MDKVKDFFSGEPGNIPIRSTDPEKADVITTSAAPFPQQDFFDLYWPTFAQLSPENNVHADIHQKLKARPLAAVGLGFFDRRDGVRAAADPGIGDTITSACRPVSPAPTGLWQGNAEGRPRLLRPAQQRRGGINGKKVELVTLDDGYETDGRLPTPAS